MAEAVLISIRPRWCELIASGKKTIEVRKTIPKINTPFKCYIYCTKDNKAQFWIARTYFYLDDHAHNAFDKCGNGAVIGEFMCDEIQRYARYGQFKEPARYMKSSPGGYPATEIHYASLQLSPDALKQYGKGAPLYGLCISDLVIYDEPKKLTDFMKPCDPDPDGVPLCFQCKRLVENYGCGGTILRPPQSWCYVEELK